MEGLRLGAYRVESELGSGGMGKVYLAKAVGKAATSPGTRVALKVIHPHLLESAGFFQRFLREARIGRAVSHPNVVRTYDADALTVEGRLHHFLVMEYVEGQNLRELLHELDRVPEELCRHIGREVAKGLTAIHAAGVVHRDLKPENVVISPDHVVKIMDLGVARLTDEAIRLSQTGLFVGSLHYAAPEQFRRGGEHVDGRADLYALGLILYELATGEHPFVADEMPQVLRNVMEVIPRRVGHLNPQLSPFLEEIILKLIAKDRDGRFASAGELLEVLEEGERSEWWSRRAHAIREETKRPVRRIRIPRETAVYGREGELRSLRSLYEKAADGHGQVALLEGEAGIGKTRLLDELVGRLRSDGEDLNFLFGSYPPGGAATAAGAWSTAYREQFGAEELEETLGEYLAETPILVPAFAALLRGEPAPPGVEPLTKDSIQTVFLHATRALARERTTLVLIEDLHFAPEEGRALLAALALAVPEQRILLVGTTRPGLPDAWRANLERLEHSTRLELTRLGPKDLASLLIDAFHSERLAERLALQIGRKSDGNPFFVFEIIRGLKEREYIKREADGSWVTTKVIRDIESPSSVQDLVQARIADLDDEEQEILDIAACCGFEFDPLLVGGLLDLPDIPLLRRLGTIERSHRLVRSAGTRYVFDHHQVQEVIYGTIPELLRERYHAGIAGCLEERGGASESNPADLDGPVVVELCEHFLRGRRGDRALRYLDASLEHLEKGYLGDQAIRLGERALAQPGMLEGTERAEVLLRLCTPLMLLGRHEELEATTGEALSLAEAGEDPALRWKAHQARGQHYAAVSKYEDARGEFERQLAAARASGDRQGEGKATANLGNVLAQTGRLAEAIEEYDKWIAVAREIGDTAGEAATLRNLGIVTFRLARHDEARGHLERGLEMARDLGDRRGESSATEGLGYLALRLGDYDEARERFERSLAISREIGDRVGEATATGSLGVLELDTGRMAEARRHFESLLPISREIGDRETEATAFANLGSILSHLGDQDGARAKLERAGSAIREIGARHLEAHLLLYLAEAAERTGDDAEAIRTFEEACAVCEEIEYPYVRSLARLGIGGILASEERFADSREHLEYAADIGEKTGSPDLIVLAACELALHPGGDAARALAAFAEHEAELCHTTKIQARFQLWRATGERAHLEAAHELLRSLRDNAPEELRESAIEGVPLHREIAAAWEKAQGS